MQKTKELQSEDKKQLSKKRVERMRKEDWYVMAYRHDTGQQGELFLNVRRDLNGRLNEICV